MYIAEKSLNPGRRRLLHLMTSALLMTELALTVIQVAQGASYNVVNPAAPTANVGGPYSGDEGNQISFSGDASDPEDPSNLLTYEWDFEFDGSFTIVESGVNLTAPTHVFTDNDNFTVALRIKDTDGNVSPVTTATVNIANVPPSINAGGPYSVDEGSPLTFCGSATDPGQDALTYEWDFDYDEVTFTVDSSGEDLTVPSTTYANDGQRTVALRVRDDDGGVSAIQSAAVTVSNVPPTASVGISFSGNEGVAIAFSGSATDPGSDTLTYEWDFTYSGGQFNVDQSGDGLTSPQSTYSNDGDYTVALRVRDDDTVSTTVTTSVSVANVLPTANAGGPYQDIVGAPVTFNGLATDQGNDTLTYEWDFEYNGTTLNTTGATTASGVDLTSPTYTYANAGTLTVGLRVSDDDGVSTVVTAQVTVNPLANPTPTPTPTPTPVPQGGGSGPAPTPTPTPTPVPAPQGGGYNPAPTPTPTPTPVPTTVVLEEDIIPIIPPEGGASSIIQRTLGVTTESPKGDVIIEMAPLTTAVTSQLEYKPLAVEDAAPPPPDSMVLKAFELNIYDSQGKQLSNVTFLKSISIRVKYTRADLITVGGDFTRLKIMYYKPETDQWIPLATTVDLINQELVAQGTPLHTIRCTCPPTRCYTYTYPDSHGPTRACGNAYRHRATNGHADTRDHSDTDSHCVPGGYAHFWPHGDADSHRAANGYANPRPQDHYDADSHRNTRAGRVFRRVSHRHHHWGHRGCIGGNGRDCVLPAEKGADRPVILYEEI